MSEYLCRIFPICSSKYIHLSFLSCSGLQGRLAFLDYINSPLTARLGQWEAPQEIRDVIQVKIFIPCSLPAR